MGSNLKVKETCSSCGGTGDQPLHPTGSVTCSMCGGSGKRETATIHLDVDFDDVMDKLNDVMDKLDDIQEKLDE